MKILVTLKSVPDPDQPIAINAAGTGLDSTATTFIINPFDAIAVEQAVRMREDGQAVDEIIVLSIGGLECEKNLRTALAMGADRALWVEDGERLDPWNVSRVIHKVVEAEQPDMVIMGKQAVDDDSNQVGQFLAAQLSWPQATFASGVEVSGDRLVVQREVDQGIERLAVSMPVVMTCDLRLNEPRYTALPAIMKAKRKPLERTSLKELGIESEARVEVLSIEATSSNRECVLLESVDELISKLRDEAKVIT